MKLVEALFIKMGDERIFALKQAKSSHSISRKILFMNKIKLNFEYLAYKTYTPCKGKTPHFKLNFHLQLFPSGGKGKKKPKTSYPVTNKKPPELQLGISDITIYKKGRWS